MLKKNVIKTGLAGAAASFYALWCIKDTAEHATMRKHGKPLPFLMI